MAEAKKVALDEPLDRFDPLNHRRELILDVGSETSTTETKHVLGICPFFANGPCQLKVSVASMFSVIPAERAAPDASTERGSIMRWNGREWMNDGKRSKEPGPAALSDGVAPFGHA